MKKLILHTLKEKQGYVSGEELSNSLGVSRTAVWKHINELRKEGYIIESSSKKGYRLTGLPDILDGREVSVPDGQQIGRELVHFADIDSTNNYAKKIGNDGCPHGTVVTAERQTLGRGRVGRLWQSDNSRGLWFSIVLRPDLEPEKVQIITLAASVAVVEGIIEVLDINCGIKWPNDIILGSCKLGGILTELSAEPGHVNYVVVGIGLNINQDSGDFDQELQDKAASLKLFTGKTHSRAKILSGILKSFEKIYTMLLAGETRQIIDKWNKYSVTVGKEVRIISREVEYIGTAQSVALDGKLVVKCKDGTLREVSSGEVQVRGLMGYARD
ncbi:bifunctional ligase/repressor BirA [Ruminiclostridium hungatei]|uniref:Bifunctional ligase/repressor BirA n=1 Tax=Ruminiclostridium hungatei TaxID=48256 RepID=A0A1V4SP87_RUMHU|nr:biotin--[acetyl-CoA-carboxylase] ligase [Ruminiclostridium hungatei]OPX45613.1 bifunctional ligase/repressor BirA [Ruminiclostridium hungatei]